jgi:hypothetical protein
MKNSLEKIMDLVEQLNKKTNEGKFEEIISDLDKIYEIYKHEINNPKVKLTSLVKMMHNKFGITSEQVQFSEEEKKFRICAMQEELDEYKEAKTKEDELDALVDLVVFAMGTAERQGMLEVFDEAFKRVMEANCKKEIGQNQKRGSFQLDLVKPEGWTSPCHKDLVGENV